MFGCETFAFSRTVSRKLSIDVIDWLRSRFKRVSDTFRLIEICNASWTSVSFSDFINLVNS